MRIIAGQYRGRKLQTLPDESIRPTSSRSRESLFNILMHRFKEDGTSLLTNARFADICCGSGAIGIEALSRGASDVTFVDHKSASLDITRRNIEALGLSHQAELLQYDVGTLPKTARPYTIIFTDPPYQSGLLPVIAERALNQGWLDAQTLFITEQQKREAPFEHASFLLTDERTYGNARLCFYQTTIH